MELSKSQVDKLGERLRDAPPTRDDVKLLESYKHSFVAAYGVVLGTVQRFATSVKGRPEKSTLSIIAKLRREKMRLSRMQDIAGCRIVVRDVRVQNDLEDALQREFTKTSIKDRRDRPSHGYRAVHLIVGVDQKTIEVQIRTELQQLWAEISEAAFDVIDPAIKYGGGPEEFRSLLLSWSKEIADYENAEMAVGEPATLKSRRNALVEKPSSGHSCFGYNEEKGSPLMIFLIDYDRKPAKLVSSRAFENSERTAAQDAKLQLELALHREGIQREVVLIDADSEQELRRGYRRYFEDLPTLIRSAIQTLESRQIG